MFSRLSMCSSTRSAPQWFELMEKPHMVFWWVEEGHQPDLQEALDRLEHYQKHGATEYAFGWAEVIDKERWHAQRCA